MVVETATQFKVGEWVFFEFNLSQVLGLSDGLVNEVTDGACRHSGYNLSERCMPLTVPMKQIADHFEYVSKRIHREGSSGLNYPDIHRWLVNLWVIACGKVSNEKALAEDLKRLHAFENDVLKKQDVDSGYGFPLMRSRR